jgi:hypothetical protein
VDLLQSLNSVVQSGHHLHLELEELLRGQGWRHRHRCWLAGTLVILPLLARTRTGAPGVHHLFAAEQNLQETDIVRFWKENSGRIKYREKSVRFYPQPSNSIFLYYLFILIQVCVKVDLHE